MQAGLRIPADPRPGERRLQALGQRGILRPPAASMGQAQIGGITVEITLDGCEQGLFRLLEAPEFLICKPQFEMGLGKPGLLLQAYLIYGCSLCGTVHICQQVGDLQLQRPVPVDAHLPRRGGCQPRLSADPD